MDSANLKNKLIDDLQSSRHCHLSKVLMILANLYFHLTLQDMKDLLKLLHDYECCEFEQILAFPLGNSDADSFASIQVVLFDCADNSLFNTDEIKAQVVLLVHLLLLDSMIEEYPNMLNRLCLEKINMLEITSRYHQRESVWNGRQREELVAQQNLKDSLYAEITEYSVAIAVSKFYNEELSLEYLLRYQLLLGQSLINTKLLMGLNYQFQFKMDLSNLISDYCTNADIDQRELLDLYNRSSNDKELYSICLILKQMVPLALFYINDLAVMFDITLRLVTRVNEKRSEFLNLLPIILDKIPIDSPGIVGIKQQMMQRLERLGNDRMTDINTKRTINKILEAS
jgi:hypothetical protein